MWQVIYKHLNYSHLHWLGIFTVDKEYKRKQFQTGTLRNKTQRSILGSDCMTLIIML